MNYSDKYLKYKKKYINLKKGGELILKDTPLDKIIIGTEHTNIYKKYQCEDKIDYVISDYNFIIKKIEKTKYYWSLDVNKIFKDNADLCNIYEPKHFHCKLNFILYNSDPNIFKKYYFNKSINKIKTCMDKCSTPYAYNLVLQYYNPNTEELVPELNINLFNNYFSFNLNVNIIFSLIRDWLSEKKKQYNKVFNILERPEGEQIYIKYTESPSSRKIKIHINLKLEYIFWFYELLLKDDELHKYISQFKITTNFCRFGILNGYLSREPLEYYKDEYCNAKDGVKLKTEELNDIMFVLYIKNNSKSSTDNFDNGYENANKAIRILMKLIPDELGLSINSHPRFSFKINECIYFAIGDTGEKLDYGELIYEAPTDYLDIVLQDKCQEIDMAKHNLIKILSNHILCTQDEEKNYKPNNIYTYKLLNFREKLTLEGIYKKVGLEDRYEYYKHKASNI